MDESKEKVKELYEWATNQKQKLILILLVFLFSSSPAAFAWDPTTNDLSGTGTSTSTLGDRFDIDSTTAGIQIGEDGESIAFLLVLPDFAMPGMIAGDQYQVSFTIASKDFALVFLASASKDGSITLFYKDTASSTWSTGDTHSETNMRSNNPYRSLSGFVGFTIDSGVFVKLVVAKANLYELGGTETAITGIFGATFEAGDGTPGNGGATPNDRCPSSGEVAFSLLQGIDDFPHGTLVLAIPLMGFYVVFSRKKRKERR